MRDWQNGGRYYGFYTVVKKRPDSPLTSLVKNHHEQCLDKLFPVGIQLFKHIFHKIYILQITTYNTVGTAHASYKNWSQ